MHGTERIVGIKKDCIGQEGDPTEYCTKEIEMVKQLQKIFHCKMKYESRSENLQYYQWVVFILLLKAGLFRLPHILWKSLEGDIISSFFGTDEKGKIDDTIKSK